MLKIAFAYQKYSCCICSNWLVLPLFAHLKAICFDTKDLYVVFLQTWYCPYTNWVPWLGELVATLVPHVVVSTKYEAVWIVMCVMNVALLRNSNNATSVAGNILVQSMCASITWDGTHLITMKSINYARGMNLDLY